MAKRKAKEVVAGAAEKVVTAAKETNAENGAEVAKEAAEAGVATKSFLKEVGEMIVAALKYVGKFFKKLFTRK